MILTFFYAIGTAALLRLPAYYTWRRARRLAPCAGLVTGAIAVAARIALLHSRERSPLQHAQPAPGVSAGLTASPRAVHPGPDGDRCCAGEAHRALDWPSSRGLATASHCPSPLGRWACGIPRRFTRCGRTGQQSARRGSYVIAPRLKPAKHLPGLGSLRRCRPRQVCRC
jgi:hypothetical protein